ncbi:MAG TPA: hypothetical protein VKA15_03045 [Isosphaeraceae bacterium]|nr:hypothetical protein [Isosphaeraceae bacterium]
MTQILILACCVYVSLLIAAVYFTRATTRRVLGALAGGGAVALVGAGVEALAHAQGWWRYTSDDTLYGPLAIYPLLVVAFAFLALIGWRVTRRFGSRGLAVFLGILAVVGTLRDYFIAGSLMGLIVFARGVVLAIIDAFLWAGLTALAIAVMRAVSGPARDDGLARRPGDSV